MPLIERLPTFGRHVVVPIREVAVRKRRRLLMQRVKVQSLGLAKQKVETVGGSRRAGYVSLPDEQV